MTAKEARQEQWKKLKDQPLSAKAKYIFTYYWMAIALSVFVVIFITSWIVSALTSKDAVLSGCLVNSTMLQSYQGSLADEFVETQQIDTQKYTFDLMTGVYLDATDISALESIVTRIAVGDLDFVVVDLYTYPLLSAYWADLESVLTEEQLEKYHPYMVYVERDALRTLEEDSIDNGLVLPKYYQDPSELADPVPLGIRIPETSRLFDAYAFPKDDIIFGISETNQRLDMTMAFLDFLFSKE